MLFQVFIWVYIYGRDLSGEHIFILEKKEYDAAHAIKMLLVSMFLFGRRKRGKKEKRRKKGRGLEDGCGDEVVVMGECSLPEGS